MKKRSVQHLPDHFGMVSRRDFLKFCSMTAAAMGLPVSMGVKIAEAVASPKRLYQPGRQYRRHGVETLELPPAPPEAPYYDEAMLFGLAPFSFDHWWIMIIDP